MMIYVINAHNKMFFVLHDNNKNLVDVWICFYVFVLYYIVKIMFGDTTKIYNLILFIDGWESFSLFFLLCNKIYAIQRR